MNAARAILYFLLGIFAAQFAYYFVNLPENFAVHFNARGEPDAWTTKNSFAIIESAILIFTLGAFLIFPLMMDKLPVSLINLPNKSFWLADNRRSETFRFIKKSFEWLTVFIVGFYIAVNQLIFRANILGQNLPLVEFFIILILFFAALIIWLRIFTKHFKKL